MALIQCPQCGKEVSSLAKKCPNCGFVFDGKETEDNAPDNDCSNGDEEQNQNESTPVFAAQNLIQGERILCSAKWHWMNYALFALVGIAGVYLLYRMIKENPYIDNVMFIIPPAILILVAIIGYISIEHNEFVITNRRIIIKSGIIMRQSYELRLELLESIQVYQGILGRMFEYGTIIVHGVGASRGIAMRLESPLEFRQKIFEEIGKQSKKTKE